MNYLENDYSNITGHEGDHPFTECATFGDDIKGMGYSFQSSWHFINIPYFDKGGDESDFPNFHQPAQDVVGALTDLVGFLKGETSVGDSYYLQQIAKHFSKLEDQQSFALRLVIHYIGDIHQPLHAVAAVDNTYPTGDEGGNKEKIPSYEGVSDLHFVWDSVVYEFTGRESLVSPPTSVRINKSLTLFIFFSPFLTLTGPGTPTPATNCTPPTPLAPTLMSRLDSSWTGPMRAWKSLRNMFILVSSPTSFLIILSIAFVAGQDPDQAYIDAGRPICEERLMWGARRLAETIKDIYGTKVAFTFTE